MPTSCKKNSWLRTGQTIPSSCRWSVAQSGRPVTGGACVYMEMVAVLWSRGLYQEALCLEGLWNTLQTTESFTLLHAYPHRPQAHTPGADPETLLALYHAHSHVLHQNPESPIPPSTR